MFEHVSAQAVREILHKALTLSWAKGMDVLPREQKEKYI